MLELVSAGYELLIHSSLACVLPDLMAGISVPSSVTDEQFSFFWSPVPVLFINILINIAYAFLHFVF